MNFLTWLLYRRLFISLSFDDATSAGSSSGSSSEPSVEQLQQQVRETAAKYEELSKRVEKGELVEPNKWIQDQVEKGLYFPKERYVGLQQTFQSEQEAHKGAVGTIASLTTQQKTIEKQIAALEEANKSLTTQLQEKETQITGLSSSVNRKSLIMGEFPHLAGFEAKGLLPPGEGDTLKTLLSEFTAQLQSEGSKAVDTFAAGGGPRTPTSSDDVKPDKPSSPEDIQRLAFQKLREGNQKEYDSLMDTYYAEKIKEAAKV